MKKKNRTENENERMRGEKHERNQANKQICGDFNVTTHKINGNH